MNKFFDTLNTRCLVLILFEYALYVSQDFRILALGFHQQHWMMMQSPFL